MIDFIKAHYELVGSCVLLVLSLLLTLLKKKPVKVIDSVMTAICRVLPGLLTEAEKLFGQGRGEDKLNWVLAQVCLYINETCPEVNFGLYREPVKVLIEDILSTPQKKGEKNG